MSVRKSVIFCVLVFLSWCGAAEAARQFTIVQTNPAAPAEVVMGTTQSITIRVTNTCNGWNAGERLYEMRFRLPGTGTVFSNTTAAPAGWTRTAWSTTSVTFQASSWANALVSGASLDFTLVLVMRSTTADTTETLRDARAGFTLDTNFGNGVNRTGRSTINNPGSWSLKSLSMTLVPSAFNVGTGCTFTLTMSVTNRSTSNITGVTSVPKPPTRTGVNATTTSNPANLNLGASGGNGTMVWTYTAGAAAGTVTLTAYARDSSGSRTSSTVTTAPMTITLGNSCTFTAAILVTPACLFSGDIATFTMTVTNTTGVTLNNVFPNPVLTPFGTAVIGAFAGPVPGTPITLANNSSNTFTWTAPVTGNINDTYGVTGYATANGPIQTSTATSNTQDVEGYTVTVSPATTNAESTTEEATWTVVNGGCGNINQVSIAVPGGWAAPSDAYALVDNTAGTQVETWTPVAPGTVFTSPNATDRVPFGGSGDFSLLFPGTPSATGAYVFNVTIIDDTAPTPVTKVIATTLTVQPFDTGGINAAGTGIWMENIR